VSLRTRIVILFIGFAGLPIILLGFGDYFQSIDALGEVIEARSAALASETARELEREHAEARADLREVGELLALSSLPDSVVTGLPAAARFDSIRVATGTGSSRVLVRAGGVAASPPCGGPGDPVRVELVGPAAGIERIVGFTSVTDLATAVPPMSSRLGHDGHTRIVGESSGRVLFDSRCLHGDSEESALDADPGGPPAAGPEPGSQWIISNARVEALGWIIAVHSSEEEFLVPFRRSRLLYIGLVLLLLTVAAAAFALLARGSFRSLRALTAAADQVELGNMRPWIPPPGDDDIGRLAVAFRKMTDRLDESLRQNEINQKLAAVGELASYLSHEIRNPLSSIKLSLQTLHRDLSAGFIPPDASRIIQIALNEVKRLDGVVRTILEVGREPRQVDADSTCDAHSTITDAVEVIMPRARAKEVDLDFLPLADRHVVVGEPEGLRSVWINLIVNALDAVEDQENGVIRISTRIGAGGDELHVRVADNGPGVPASAVDSIFEPFFTTKEEGNGIGLATASRTLQAAGGSIAYEPLVAGAGAVFVVRLKLADAGDARVSEPGEQQEPTLVSRGAA
jgi:signal transduction histidine kinase